MKADFDAEVMVRPMFCATNPRNMKSESTAPFIMDALGMGKIRLWKKSSRTTVATTKRTAISRTGDT